MAEQTDNGDEKKMDKEERDERMEKLRHLVNERGEDAAKMVRTWLQQQTNDQNE